MGHDTSMDEIRGWFAGRIPDGWFTAAPAVDGDREEILVTGELADVKVAKGASATEQAAARESRVDGFREETREARMAIAEDAQPRFRRRGSWAVSTGGRPYPLPPAARPGLTAPG